jgi:MFS transporter, CP family, cyanate transporter
MVGLAVPTGPRHRGHYPGPSHGRYPGPSHGRYPGPSHGRPSRGRYQGRHRLATPVSAAGSQLLCAVGIVAVGLNLRCAVTSLGALLAGPVAQWRLTGTQAGLLTALPVLSFAVFGVLAPRPAARWGAPRVVAVTMALAACGLLARAMAGSFALFALASVLALSGAAVGNVLLPPLVKQYFPAHTGAATAAYSTALALGMTAGAGLSVPLQRALGGDWRAGLGVWALPALLAVPPWVALATRHRRPRAATPERRHPPVRHSRTARWLALFFGCQSLNAYVVLGWLPSILTSAGVPPRTAAGALALFGLMSIPMSLLLPGLAARRPGALVLVTAAGYAAGYLGLLAAPAAAPWLWAVLLGVGNGALPLAVTLVGLRSVRAEVTTALSGMAQGGGYLLAAAGPLLAGAAHQYSGGWRLPLLLVLATLPGQLAAGLRAARPGSVDAELGGPRHALRAREWRATL